MTNLTVAFHNFANAPKYDTSRWLMWNKCTDWVGRR